jgi:dihydropyrimidinase
MAFGGVATHLDFVFVHPATDIPTALNRRLERWKDKSYIDYSFHIALGGALPARIFDQMPEAIAQGFPSFKIFTNEVLPPHPKRQPFKLDFGRIGLAMEQAARHGGIMVVHAEDDDIVHFNYERFKEKGLPDGNNLHLFIPNCPKSWRSRAPSSWPRGPVLRFTSFTPRPRKGLNQW